MTKIYLVRHTQTKGNLEKRLTGRSDYELTKDGELFVEKMNRRLSEVKFDIAYCSTSRRTKKTIEVLAYKNKIPIIERQNLCEMYFGIYDGWKWEDVNKVNPAINKMHLEINQIIGIPEQETTAKVAERIFNEIKRISEDNIGKTILICSHGVAIEAFLRKISGDEFKTKIEEYRQYNCSINILNYIESTKSFETEKLNDKDYLYDI